MPAQNIRFSRGAWAARPCRAAGSASLTGTLCWQGPWRISGAVRDGHRCRPEGWPGRPGTILGLPGSPVHLEIVRLGDARHPARGLDQLGFYLPDAAAQERITARLAAAGVHPVAQIDYGEANGGVTFQDPDGREVVFASWIYSSPNPDPR
jgi:hypothetical protein